MLKYLDFNSEKILESLINESRIYYTPKFRRILSPINNEISKDLLSIRGSDIKSDITYVDTNKEGYISFTTMRNAVDFYMRVFPHLKNNGIDNCKNDELADSIWDQSEISNHSRNLMRMGRFINTLFPKKYTDKQIEEFVNLFKASTERSQEKMIIVEGEEIAFWYDKKNYMESKGSLGNSCMRGHGPNVFDIYIKNPQSCRMLVLIEDEKLKGRALIWKIDTIKDVKVVKEVTPPLDQLQDSSVEFVYFLDRQYTMSDSDTIRFKKYAEDQGWAYKTYNNYTSCKLVTYKGIEYELNMTVSAKASSTDRYPYMDTFKRFDSKSGTLYNDKDEDTIKNKGQYILESTEGEYEEIGDGVWSDYYDEKIPDGKWVRSEPLGDYLWKDTSIEVKFGSQGHLGWWPFDDDENDDIVKCSITNEYICIQDAQWDDESSTWYLKERYRPEKHKTI